MITLLNILILFMIHGCLLHNYQRLSTLSSTLILTKPVICMMAESWLSAQQDRRSARRGNMSETECGNTHTQNMEGAKENTAL